MRRRHPHHQGKCSFVRRAERCISTRRSPSRGRAAVCQPRASGIGVSIATSLRASGLPDEATLLLLAAAPVVELRGAVPVAHWMGIAPLKGFIIAVLGNMIPVPLILIFLRPLADFFATRSATMNRFFTWLFSRSIARAKTLESASSDLGRALTALMLFVALPLPLTGAWTGAIAASILDFPLLPSFIAILIGVGIAGTIMTALTLSGWIGASIAGVSLATLAAASIMRSSHPPAAPSQASPS